METFGASFIAVLFLVFSSNADAAAKLRIACEGDDVMNWVRCPNEDEGMQIESAKFGRDNNIMCQPETGEKNENNTRLCGSKDVTEIIRPFCEGKQKCDSFIANVANLGQPKKCQYVRKFLRMYVLCVRITDPDEPEKPSAEKPPNKKDRKLYSIHDTTETHSVNFDQVHDSSSSTKPLALLLFVGAFCSLYY